MNESIWMWVGFNAAVMLFLALDLGVFNRKAHKVGMKEALGWSVFWIVLSLCFNYYLYLKYGPTYGVEFLTGYLVEKSLSVDNIFVFVLIFRYFKVPDEYQHKILFWGIIGALLLRGSMIAAGSYLISQFHWIIYIFGVFLFYTGIKILFFKHDEEQDLAKNPVVRFVHKFFPVTEHYHGSKFFTRIKGQKRVATPMLLVLVVVEFTDLIFAVDSIPAIFAITKDTYIIYTSNVCAILGLRALYFLLADFVEKFRYLQPALGIILAFVGVKMLLSHTAWEINSFVSLLIIIGVLTVAAIASVIAAKREGRENFE